MTAKGKVTPDEPIIILCTPIIDDGKFVGAAVTVFDTTFLLGILSKKKAGTTGYAYLINSDGLVLVHPKKEFIFNFNILNQSGTREFDRLMKTRTTGTASYWFDGSEFIAGLSSVELTDWIAVFRQSREEITAPVKDILSSILIGGIIFMFSSIIIIIFISTKFSYPISKIIETMKYVTKHSSEVILQIGLDRKIVFANPAYEKITGLKSGEIVGTIPILENPANIPVEDIWLLIEAGITWSGRITLKNNRADLITLDVMLIPLMDEDGVIQGYLQIGRDITADLMFEKRLQQSQKLEAIGTLAGGIAHDFNNILSGIFGFAELSLIKKDSAKDVENYVKEIMLAAKRARDLVRQILTFSRKTEVELRPLNPKSVIKEALKLLRASIPASIEIEEQITSDSVILAEPTQIHQLIMNIFTNAVHAIGEKVGRIAIELNDFLVNDEFIRTHPDIKPGKHILIRITDNGCGMEPETLEHIFDPFYTTKTGGQGSGLGLSVVHGIVKNLDGVISVYSEIGLGTVFNIIIPSIKADELDIQKTDSTIKKGEDRIIIIDDETSISTAMQHILTSLGYKVTAYTDSRKGLAAIHNNSHNYDIVITDHSMPQITGLDIAKDLKQSGINIPVILISGYLGKDMEMVAREIGISEILIKPISTYQLTDAIQRVSNKEKSQHSLM